MSLNIPQTIAPEILTEPSLLVTVIQEINRLGLEFPSSSADTAVGPKASFLSDIKQVQDYDKLNNIGLAQILTDAITNCAGLYETSIPYSMSQPNSSREYKISQYELEKYSQNFPANIDEIISQQIIITDSLTYDDDIEDVIANLFGGIEQLFCANYRRLVTEIPNKYRYVPTQINKTHDSFLKNRIWLPRKKVC